MAFNQGHASFGRGGPGGGGPGGTTSGIQSLNLATGPAVLIQAGSGIASIVRIANNIYINASGVAPGVNDINGATGPSITLKPGYNVISIVRDNNDLYVNVSGIDLTGSGFATTTQITQSGYLLASDRMYPIDARQASGNVVPNTSGSWNLGSQTRFWHQVWANSGIFQSGISVSGLDTIYRINDIAGPFVHLKAGSGVHSIVVQDHDIYINTSGGGTGTGTITDINSATGPSVTFRPGSGIISIVRDGNDIYINASGSTLSCLETLIWTYSGTGSSLNSGLITSDICFASGIRAGSGVSILDIGGIAMINASGAIRTINTLAGPGITIAAGSGVHSIVEVGNIIYINTSGATVQGGSGISSINGEDGPLITIGAGPGISIGTSTDAVTISADLTASGFATVSQIHTSGYLKASDRLYPVDARPVSGHIIPDTSGVYNIGSSGSPFNAIYAKSGIYIGSAIIISGFEVIYRINDKAGPFIDIKTGYGTDVVTQGKDIYINLAQSSGFITKTEVANSGFLTRTELITSGYTTLEEIKNNLHTSGYIRNVDFVTSGFQTASQITASGYLKISDRLYPVDARAVSGHIVPNSSGTWNLGNSTTFFHQLWANSGIYQSGISVSGLDTIYKINGLAGPHVTLKPGAGAISVVAVDHDLYINVSGGGVSSPESDQYPVDARAVSGHIIPNSSGAWDIGSAAQYMKDIYTNRLFAQSGLNVSGVNTVYTEIKAGTGTTIINVGNDIYINASGQSDFPVDARAVSGHILFNASGKWDIGTRAIPPNQIYANSGYFASGITVSRHILANTSGVNNIGDTSNYFNNIYCNTINLAGSTNVTAHNFFQGFDSTRSRGFSGFFVSPDGVGVVINTSGFMLESGVAYSRRFIYPHDGMGVAGQTYKSNGVYTINASGTTSNPNDNRRMCTHYVTAGSATAVATVGAIVSQNLRPQDNIDFKCDFKMMVSGGTTATWIGLMNLNPNVSGLENLARDTRFQCAALYYKNGLPNWYFVTKGTNSNATSGAIPTGILPIPENEWHDVSIYTLNGGTNWMIDIDDKHAIVNNSSEVPTSGSSMGPIIQIAGNAVSFRNSYMSTRVNSPRQMPFDD